jgi:hypothetical protein
MDELDSLKAVYNEIIEDFGDIESRIKKRGVG